MGVELNFPTSAAKSYGSELLNAIEELTNIRDGLQSVIDLLDKTWKGAGKASFQEKASGIKNSLVNCITMFENASAIFPAQANELRNLLTISNSIGGAFGVASAATDDGTVFLDSNGDALTNIRDQIITIYDKAAESIQNACKNIEGLKSVSFSSETLKNQLGGIENNAGKFDSFVENYENYCSQVQSYCDTLKSSCEEFTIPDEYCETSFTSMCIAAMSPTAFLLLDPDTMSYTERAQWVARVKAVNPSLLTGEARDVWVNLMYAWCMEDPELWKDMLRQAAADISDAEYEVLARVYANLEDFELLSDFLELCAVGAEYSYSYYTMYGYDWEVQMQYFAYTSDQNKLEKIQEFVQKLYLEALQNVRSTRSSPDDPNPDEYRIACEEMNRILQRKILLSEFSRIDKFGVENGKEGPLSLSVQQSEDGVLTLSYRIPLPLDDSENYANTTGEISIGVPETDSSFLSLINDQGEASLINHFQFNLLSSLLGFSLETSIDVVVSKSLALLLKSGPKTELASIVFSGFMSIIADKYEADQDVNYIKQIFAEMDELNLFAALGCNGVLVTRKEGKKESTAIVYDEGWETSNIVSDLSVFEPDKMEDIQKYFDDLTV